ncbi:hypothetical protein JKP88DRAFT_294234 [Tribonema minus]|uniref:Uncharacterized protein n=1 Tax=Tribonema minus TaxID=303371 RepID=A0A835ZE46_9STRA|nr:hypothetical protein JKP88DRAFT_294234 [Tribonema minus]
MQLKGATADPLALEAPLNAQGIRQSCPHFRTPKQLRSAATKLMHFCFRSSASAVACCSRCAWLLRRMNSLLIIPVLTAITFVLHPDGLTWMLLNFLATSVSKTHQRLGLPLCVIAFSLFYLCLKLCKKKLASAPDASTGGACPAACAPCGGTLQHVGGKGKRSKKGGKHHHIACSRTRRPAGSVDFHQPKDRGYSDGALVWRRRNGSSDGGGSGGDSSSSDGEHSMGSQLRRRQQQRSVDGKAAASDELERATSVHSAGSQRRGRGWSSDDSTRSRHSDTTAAGSPTPSFTKPFTPSAPAAMPAKPVDDADAAAGGASSGGGGDSAAAAAVRAKQGAPAADAQSSPQMRTGRVATHTIAAHSSNTVNSGGSSAHKPASAKTAAAAVTRKGSWQHQQSSSGSSSSGSSAHVQTGPLHSLTERGGGGGGNRGKPAPFAAVQGGGRQQHAPHQRSTHKQQQQQTNLASDLQADENLIFITRQAAQRARQLALSRCKRQIHQPLPQAHAQQSQPYALPPPQQQHYTPPSAVSPIAAPNSDARSLIGTPLTVTVTVTAGRQQQQVPTPPIGVAATPLPPPSSVVMPAYSTFSSSGFSTTFTGTASLFGNSLVGHHAGSSGGSGGGGSGAAMDGQQDSVVDDMRAIAEQMSTSILDNDA